MEISLVSRKHPDDEVWEEYAFGRLSDTKEAAAEEHLLLCGRCQKALAETDEFIKLAKLATARYPVGAHKPRTQVALAGFMVAACIGCLMWLGPTTSAAPSVAVSLKSFRGGVGAPMNLAPAKHPLDLSVALADLPPSAQYRFEVVTSGGERIWEGPASASDGTLRAHIGKRPRGGLYWVRLYAQSSEPLVEYGLKLE